MKIILITATEGHLPISAIAFTQTGDKGSLWNTLFATKCKIGIKTNKNPSGVLVWSLLPLSLSRSSLLLPSSVLA